MKFNLSKTLAILEQVLNLGYWLMENLRPRKHETANVAEPQPTVPQPAV